MKVLLFPAYHGSPDRHGGTRRSDQLVEAIAAANPGRTDVVSLYRLTACKRPRIGEFIALVPRAIGLVLAGRISVWGMLRYMYRGPYIRRAIRHSKPNVIIFECAPEWPLLVCDLVVTSRIPCYIAPSNIEFLVPDQKQRSFPSAHAATAWEMDLLRSATGSICISSFDAAVVRCLQAKAIHFPYYPPQVIRDELEIIASERRTRASVKRTLLVAGTAINPPTREGMRRLLCGLDVTALRQAEMEVVVAGFGTESLASLVNSDRIRILGSVSDHTMRELMIGCCGLLISPEQTSGFITRLADANIAGIPVFVLGDYTQAEHLEAYGIVKIDSPSQAFEPQNRTHVNVARLSSPDIDMLQASLLISRGIK